MKIFKEFVASVVFLILIPALGSTTLWAQTGAALSVPQWLRGEGESLEIRIRGKLVRQDKQPVENASMKVVLASSEDNKSVEPKVDGSSYEVWLPIGAIDCYHVQFSVAADGARTESGVFANQIRQLAIDGFEIQLKPVRTVNALLTFKGEPVSDATVRTNVLWGGPILAKTNDEGIASFDVPVDAVLGNLTAWREQGEERLLGGFSFYENGGSIGAQPEVEMFQCETREVFVVDKNERPVPQLPLNLIMIVPKPKIAFWGLPDGVTLQTDDDGEATLDWLPKIEGISIEHSTPNRRWLSNHRVETKMDEQRLTLHFVHRPLKRIEGQIVSDDESKSGLGGFAIRLAGNDVVEMMRHFAYAFSDADGKFSVDVISDAPYLYWVEDETWVSADVNSIPADTSVDQTEPIKLTLSRGHPVKVTVVSETTGEPIPKVEISVNAQRSYPPNNIGGPRIRRVTDQSGVVEVVAAAEKLEVSAYFGDWREEEPLLIVPGQTNEITFWKKTDAVKITGRLNSNRDQKIDFQRCEIKAESIDGVSRDQYTLAADEHGAFDFETTAKKTGVIVFSEDRKLAGSVLIENLKEPVEINLYPTQSYSGQILNYRGDPIEDHRVFAWIEVVGDRARMRISVNSKTNAEGKFTFEHLPCKTLVRVGTDLHAVDQSDFEIVEKLMIEPNDPVRPLKVKRLKPPKESLLSAIAQKYARNRWDCRLSGYHLLVTVSDTSDFELQRKLKKNLAVAIRDNAEETGNPEHPSGWMTMAVDSPALNRTINRKLAKFKKWDTPEDSALICIYDASGKQLARKTFTSSAPDFADSIKTLMANNGPKKNDAVDKWETAFATANENDQRVFVLVGDLNQKPAQRLRRWMDEHEETLEKDFVLLTIDNSFDLRVDEATVALEDLNVTLPAVVVLDVDQQVVAHCGKLDPTQFGRVQMGLQQVLLEGCQTIKDDEIKRIVFQTVAIGAK